VNHCHWWLQTCNKQRRHSRLRFCCISDIAETDIIQTMKPSLKQTLTLETARGHLALQTFCSPQDISPLSMPAPPDEDDAYQPIIARKATLHAAAGELDANVTVAYTADQRIVGLGILQYAEADTRWARMPDRLMMEIAAIQVDSAWRREGLAQRIMALLCRHPLLEIKIFYMVGYSWTWDLAGTRKTAEQYRQALMRLFGRFGFEEYKTNETNVMLHPANVFMARMGQEVPAQMHKHFKDVRFNMDLY
jgi:acetoin utilization protein AcuA